MPGVANLDQAGIDNRHNDTSVRSTIIVNNALTKLEEKQDLNADYKSACRLALEALRENFLGYLALIKEHDDFPCYEYHPQKNTLRGNLSKDMRILFFAKLASNFRYGDLRVPDEIRRTPADYNQLGWPADARSPGFSHWLDFIKSMAVVLKEHNLNINLDAWAGADDPGEPLIPQVVSSSSVSESVQLNVPSKATTRYWHAPEKFKALVSGIEAMHNYGNTLKNKGHEKGGAAEVLAIELFEDLKQFYQRSDAEQEQGKAKFVQEFKHKLHSKDNIMSTHRTEWKNIIANILIALTVVGVFAISLKLHATGHFFFDKTQSEKNISYVEDELAETLGL